MDTTHDDERRSQSNISLGAIIKYVLLGLILIAAIQRVTTGTPTENAGYSKDPTTVAAWATFKATANLEATQTAIARSR